MNARGSAVGVDRLQVAILCFAFELPDALWLLWERFFDEPALEESPELLQAPLPSA
jgi:hypothetical protein